MQQPSARKFAFSAPFWVLLAGLGTTCSDDSFRDKVNGEDVEACDLDQPGAASIPQDKSCAFSHDPGTFEPEVEWRWDSSVLAPGFDNPIMMPAVGDVDRDGLPEIVLNTYANNAYGSAGALIIRHRSTSRTSPSG